MRYSLPVLAIAFFASSAFANVFPKIAGWDKAFGISEEKTVKMTIASVEEGLAFNDDDGETCTAELVYNLELVRERGTFKSSEKRFIIDSTASGPGRTCSSPNIHYLCETLFEKQINGSYKAESSCEPSGGIND